MPAVLDAPPPPQDYAYFDHEADIGIVGRGASAERALEAAAAAVFAVMCEPSALRPIDRIDFSFDEDDVEFALVRWINRLLGEARERGLVFGRFRLRRDDGHWHGAAWGEPWNDALVRGVEVKGATLTELSVRETDGRWAARCVIDV
ncbi:MAG TPA: archease [Pelomicrobium sp.]|nr:archease [Pelomicrobium sp.]